MFSDDSGFDKRMLGALFSGLLFGASWVIFVDGVVIAAESDNKSYEFKDWVPGILCTIAFAFMNAVSPSSLSNSDGMFEERDVNLNKAWFFFSVLLVFTSLTLSIVFLANTYANADGGNGQWPGYAMLIQTIGIGGSSFAFFMARGKKKEDF
eukprot:TRINITY_DN6357_c0_g1_i1.p1 TRINITY_DN6357_c0_g1~~TRINITY_DN6357_c0_g1_i1.p1  ORF type:complete len:152 (+),score=39.15 TRINITY_DN6357_c0_g1_i1:52-507(+)